MTCDECPPSIKSKCTKLCKDMDLMLERKPDGRLYSDRWIRAKEQAYDPQILDRIAGERAIRRKLGMSEGSDLSPTEKGD